jgi:hypothetical protein
MATKEASVKLTLNSGSFTGGMREIARVAADTGRKIGDGIKGPALAGFRAVKSSIAETTSTLKSTIKTAATLGGAFSFGSAVKNALDVTGAFKNLAFAIRAGTGRVVDWRDLMKDAQADALAFGRSTEEMASTFKTVWDEVADVDFAKAAMAEVGKAATATGESAEGLARIAGTLNEKFGITAKELPQTFADVISLGNQGGVTIADMGAKLEVLGASAKAAGMTGVDGFRKLIAMANLGDNSLGGFKKNVAAVTQFLDLMATRGQQKNIKLMFGVDVKDPNTGKMKDQVKVLEEIFAKTHGKQEDLEKVFTGGEAKLIVDLGKNYAKVFDETKGDIKTKTAAASAAYRKSLEDAAKSNLTAAELQKQAQERVKGPSKQFEVALERLKQSFTKPEMIDALVRFSQVLPPAVDAITKVLKMAMEHPAAAAAVVAGLKLGAPFLQGAMTAAAPSIGRALLTFGKNAAGAAFGRAAAPMLDDYGNPIRTATTAGGVAARGARIAGGALAVGAAGLAGAEVGKGIAEHIADTATGSRDELQAAARRAENTLTGGKSNDVEASRAELTSLRQRIAAEKERRSFGVGDWAATVATLGVYGGVKTAHDSLGDKALEDAENAAAKLEAALRDKAAPSAERVALAHDKLADSAEKLAQRLNAVGAGGGGGGGASRGPIPPTGVTPGYVKGSY